MHPTVSDKPVTEVFIVDNAPTAALALRAHRPSEDSTYVLCRAVGEAGGDFSQRVLRRVHCIRQHSGIGSLWYVVGTRSQEPSRCVQLLDQLLPLVEVGSRITLASPRSSSSLLFGWVDALIARHGADLELGVRFFPDALELKRTAAAHADVPSQQCA